MSWRRITGFGALWLSISAAALMAPGCYGRNCEGGSEVFGVDAGQGRMLSETRWESGPLVGQPWLWYPRQHIYFFEVPDFGGRTPVDIHLDISASPEPMRTGGNFITGSGNIALKSGVGPNRFAVQNDSCSDYYLRVLVELPALAPPVDGGAGIPDAADAGEDAADAGDAEAGP